MDIKNLTIRKAHELMKKGDARPHDLVDAYKKNISEKNDTIHAYLEVFQDIDSQATTAEAMFKGGKATLLTGIPIALKDNILLQGRIASAGSHILEHFTSPYDSTAGAKMKAEGVVFLGRTNMDEFAMGGSTENSAFGVTRNPHDTTRVPGGSSGGAVAAVAMGGALVSLGSDTGGSVRQPASFCGCVGLKPTYGSISRHGLIAMGSSLDQIGPVTNTVDDAQIVFEALRGADVMDSTSFYPQQTKQVPQKMKLGVPRHLLEIGGLSPDVIKNFNDSVDRFKKLGYEVYDIELPHAQYALAAYYILMPAEVSSNLARFDGVKYGYHKQGSNLLEDYLRTRREGFGREVRRRIMLGTYVLSAGYYDAFYGKANVVKGLIRKDYEDALKTVDVIMTPTTPTPAFKIGEKSNDPLEMYLADVFTVPANIAGVPAISIPSGFTHVDGHDLPLGIQLTAGLYEENILFRAGKDFLGEKE